MRQVTNQVCKALYNRKEIKVGRNDVVVKDDGGVMVYKLFGKIIALFRPDGTLSISNAGFETVTTKERLNGILHTFNINRHIWQQKHVWYISPEEGEGRKMFPCNTWVSV